MTLFKKQKYTFGAIAIIGFSLGMGSVNLNAQVRDIKVPERVMNTQPLYEVDTVSPEAFLTVPQFRSPGEDSLQSGTLKLDWSTQKFEVLEHRYHRQFTGYQSDPGFSPETANALQEYVDTLVGDGDQGGIVIRVDVGQDSWRGAAGDSQLNSCCRKPRIFSNKFRIASLTKIFTASVVAKLVDQGLVKWTDTVEDWFSDATWYSELPDKTITVEELVGMKAGLGNYTLHPEMQSGLFCNPLRTYTPERLLQLGLDTDSLLVPPEKKGKFYYTNTNYVLLGLLIEKAVNNRKSYEQVVREEIFEPLKLFNTAFPTSAGIPYSYDNGYLLFPSEAPPNYKAVVECTKASSYSTLPSVPGMTMTEATYSSPSSGWAAGALVSNMDEVLEAVKAQIKGEVPLLSQEILDKRYGDRLEAISSEQMIAFSSCEGLPPLYYGLGVKEYKGYKGHDGEFNGYHTVAFYNPETDTAVGLNINMYPGPHSALLMLINVIHIVETGSPCSSSTRKSVRTQDDNRTLTDIFLGISKEERKQILIPW